MVAARLVLAAALHTHPHYWATFAGMVTAGRTTAATASACRWRWPWLLVLAGGGAAGLVVVAAPLARLFSRRRRSVSTAGSF
ncbi:MAG: hypothetical protein IPK26_28530 [Planctomycetes bacterium]|nr:hypothetical protein [Planctomycetota bacterium]